MTRAEYEAKYGTAPATSTAPVKMTRAEYEARYGASPTGSAPKSFLGSIVDKVKTAARSGFQQGMEGYQQAVDAPNPLQLLEGSVKMGAGAINTVYSPLAPLFAPLGKVVNAVSDKISDIPAVQRFATSKAGKATSRVAEDVANLSTLASVVPATKVAPNISKSVTSAASKGFSKTATAGREGAINSLERNIRLAAEGTITPKKFLAKSEARGKDPVRYLAERNIEPVVRDGKMQTVEQADKLNVSAQPLNQHLDMALAEVEPGVAKTPLETLRSKALASASDVKNVTETARKQITDAINHEFDLMKQKGSDLTLRQINAFKRTQWGATKFDATKPYQGDAQYLMGKAAKQTIEDTVPKDAFSVHELNSHIGDIYDAEKFLRTLDGKAVKGGRLGKYSGRILGGMIGTAASGHPIGTFLGTLGGDGVVEILQRNTFSNPLKRMILSNIQRTNPAAYTQVLDYIKKAGLERETRPLLPAPSYTPMGPKTPAQSSVQSVPATKGPVGVDPGSGQFKKTFLSMPKED